MKMSRKRAFVYVALAIMIAVLTLSVVQAGTDLDYGQLPGVPAAANYVAWRSLAGTPPSNVITEDAYNSALGSDGGYQGGFWLLVVSTLTNAADTDQINMVFGGLGAADGTIWTHNFAWDGAGESQTDHGTVSTTSVGSCPVMLNGGLVGDQKTIRWSGPAGYYLIYRSLLPCGDAMSACAGVASNGEYEYVATVDTTVSGFTYVDTLPVGVTDSWHMVVPADASGNIIGCHSEESKPNAVQLATFQSVGAWGSPLMALGAGALGMVALGLGLRRWRKAA